MFLISDKIIKKMWKEITYPLSNFHLFFIQFYNYRPHQASIRLELGYK